MGTLKIVGKSHNVMYGDDVKECSQISWIKENSAQVAHAERIFKKYTNDGWLAIGNASGKKEQIFSFDPNLEEILLVPIVIGG